MYEEMYQLKVSVIWDIYTLNGSPINSNRLAFLKTGPPIACALRYRQGEYKKETQHSERKSLLEVYQIK